ncbi:MAG: hypothetical protein H5T68_04975 [Chloroflexi bacterium]|nr:hypothetical protein [Chloroflexota bacterium]
MKFRITMFRLSPSLWQYKLQPQVFAICKCFLPLILLTLWLFLPSQQVLSQQPGTSESIIVYALHQEDVDSNGVPDLATIDCRFASDSDRVLVYDGGADMAVSNDWQQATDFDNDSWIFDVGADGGANLIIQFATEGTRHIAYLYDDRNGDGRVAYEVTAGRVMVRESRFWTVKVVVEGGWYNSDGSINRNVVIAVDGPLGERGLDLDFVQALEINDGIVDLELECHTGEWDDMSAYCLTRLFTPFPWGDIGRTKLRVAIPGYPLPEIKGFVFWPHLGPGLYTPRLPREIPPALRMDWATACFNRPQGINNLLQPEGPEAGWWLYSSRAVIKGQDNALDFENPFAHYDLAADHDGWAELVIRHVYSPPGTVWYKIGDRYWPSRDPENTLQIVRYTWDQDNDGYWEYKLGLIGKNRVDTVVTFPDFGLVSIPYPQLPYALTDRMQWDGATFVQVEGQQESSPEGVYEWDEIYPLSRQFLFGLGDKLDPGMDDIRANFRGEYLVRQFATPRLYLSPVDRKLHLFGAEAGVWNRNDVQRIRYKDLDKDGYLDQWTFTSRPQSETPMGEEANQETPEQVVETPLKSLQWSHGYLLYGDAERVKAVRAQVPHSLFETLPPRDHEEWLALGEQLERYHKDFAPDDFLGMMAQFQGPTTEMEGAQMEDFRLTEDGFRFVLHLHAGFRVLDDENGLGVANLPAGSYLVRYAGAFQVQPLTQPYITLPPGELVCDPAAPQQLDWATIRAVLRNSGLRDCRSLPVRLYAAHEGGAPVLLAEERVAVPGEGAYVWTCHWAPPKPGRWAVWVEADESQAVPGETALGAMARLELEVEPAPMPRLFAPREAYDGVRFTWPVALLLGSAGLAATAVLGLILSSSTKGEQEGSRQRMPNESGAGNIRFSIR